MFGHFWKLSSNKRQIQHDTAWCSCCQYQQLLKSGVTKHVFELGFPVFYHVFRIRIWSHNRWTLEKVLFPRISNLHTDSILRFRAAQVVRHFASCSLAKSLRRPVGTLSGKFAPWEFCLQISWLHCALLPKSGSRFLNLGNAVVVPWTVFFFLADDRVQKSACGLKQNQPLNANMFLRAVD